MKMLDQRTAVAFPPFPPDVECSVNASTRYWPSTFSENDTEPSGSPVAK
jgi:hypothetical protein